MDEARAQALEERFLIVAPIGRDAALTMRLLAHAQLAGTACADVDDMCTLFEREGAAALIVAEEALRRTALSRLGEVLARQSAWSDIPVLIFLGSTAMTRKRPDPERLVEALGNVTLLERPIRPITMLSAASSALRARRRQYEARSELRAQRLAVEQRDQFLAMLGHELRNPLSAMAMALALEEKHDQRRYRDIMSRQLAHLTRLVDDLLDTARVTSGKVTLKRHDIDLAALTMRSVNALRPSVQKSGCALRCNAPEKPLWVHADPVRIEQVLSNLITNASKYTPAGGAIDVSVCEDATHATVVVRDTGVGLAPEMLGRVFDLFTQVDGTLERAKGGLGLGLTLVRSLLELHGGTVRAESAGLGKGSTFTVRLPLVAPASREDTTAAPSSSAARGTGAHDMLIIEDNDDSRELLTMLLARRGHRVFSARDGISGVEAASAHRPSVLLADIGLPGIDGYEVARRVRELLGDSVYMIAVTGYGQPEDRRRALAAGFDLHLTKPVAVDALERALPPPRR